MPVAVIYSRHYQINVPNIEKYHPFDFNKYTRIYQQLLADKLLDSKIVYEPESIEHQDLLRVHTPDYLQSLKHSAAIAQYLETPLLAAVPVLMINHILLRPLRYLTGGTLLAARQALQYGIGINIGGGYHHAKPHIGEGFCIYADMPIAVRILQAEEKIKRVLIIDLDVHQGNGTVACLNHDPDIFTFSMHQWNIFPYPKAKSTLDIELGPGTQDDEYLQILEEHLPRLFEDARPDLVFLQAGCDTLADDPLAELSMTEKGIVERDALVIDECVQRSVPVVMTLGGGYSPHAWHCQYASVKRTIENHRIAETTQAAR